ncbi:MAG: hypothetical protein GXP53_06710 [Deltaproteobacteria bacterium]|nr:hypothetical protein [Deltaproteobacteria bacterium]
MLGNAGFYDIKIISEIGFNSSPKTRGALFYAKKPGIMKSGLRESSP